MGELYDRNRNYAAGKQDIEKYKSLLCVDKNASWVNIDCGSGIAARIIARINKKYFQIIKNYKMIERLKSLV